MLQPSLLQLINKYCQFINCNSNQKYEKKSVIKQSKGLFCLKLKSI